MNKINTPIFTIIDLARATGVGAPTIRGWMQRGHLPLLSGDAASPQNGAARKFTGRTAIVIGIAGALMSIGNKPHVAVQAAVKFAHTEHWIEKARSGTSIFVAIFDNDTSLLTQDAAEVFTSPIIHKAAHRLALILHANEALDGVVSALDLEV